MDPDEKKKSPFPCPCTYRTALTFYVDVISPPKLHVVRELAQHTEDPKEKEFLLRITSKEGKREYSTWVVHDGRSLVQILEQLPSVNPPLDVRVPVHRCIHVVWAVCMFGEYMSVHVCD